MRGQADRQSPPDAAVDQRVLELLAELLRRTHLSSPAELAAVIVDQSASIGAHDAALYVIDYEHDMLVPLPGSAGAELQPLSVAGTVAGRAFATTSILTTPGDAPGDRRVWLPLLDGTERLGAMAMSFAERDFSEAIVAACARYAHLVAILLVAKSAYSDFLAIARRRQPMTIASELLWSLAPPLTFATEGVALAGMLEPCYDTGGDALDYAVNGRTLHLGVLDAMGHGLAAAGVAAFALAAYRQSRRSGRGLLETYAAMDEAVRRQFPEYRFVTALIAELDLDTGRLSWISAGHPPPLLIRGGRRARTLPTQPAPPLGVDFAGDGPSVAEEPLEPGDLLLLYTDGMTEARGPDGSMFTIDGLSEFIEREAAAGQTTPETLRRLRRAILDSERAQLRDDATALLVEWQRGGERMLMPQTIA
ncbi:MAG: PP2C family protein-serine/threonine phosphatase [Gemmatimonadaceae bacterium]